MESESKTAVCETAERNLWNGTQIWKDELGCGRRKIIQQFYKTHRDTF